MVGIPEMLALEATCLLAAFALGLFLYFINNLLRIRKNFRELLPFLGLTIIFLFFGIANLIVSWFDYFRWEYSIALNDLFKEE